MDRPPAGEVDLQITGLGPAVATRAIKAGAFYRASHLARGFDVTVKIVPGSRGGEARVRFERELQAMTRLSAVDGILPMLEAGVTIDGDLYLMAPHVEGRTLQERLDADGPLAWDEAAALIEQVAYTMHHAHVLGVVHRDLKPSTIVVEADTGRAVITELGFVGLTMDATAAAAGRAEEPVFTAGFSPPEAYRTGPPTLHTDIYALGATLWALIVGRPPFTTRAGIDSLDEVIGRTETCRVGDLRRIAPEAVVEVIERATECLPGDRFESAATFAQALRDARLATDPTFLVIPGAVIAGWRTDGAVRAVTITPEPAPASPAPIAPGRHASNEPATDRRDDPRRHAPIPSAHRPHDSDDRRRASILVGAGVVAIALVALTASGILIALVDDPDDPVRISGPLVDTVDDSSDDLAEPTAPPAEGEEPPPAEVLGVEVEPGSSLQLAPFVIPTPTPTPPESSTSPDPTPQTITSAPPPATPTPDEVISAPPPPPTATPTSPTATPRATATPVPTATVAPSATPVPTATPAPATTPTPEVIVTPTTSPPA